MVTFISFPPIDPATERKYRALTLSTDGQVLSSDALAAVDDVEALCKARSAMTSYAVELWDGLRFVERVEAPRRPLTGVDAEPPRS